MVKKILLNSLISLIGLLFIAFAIVAAPITFDKRPLSESEIALAQSLFGDSVELEKVRMNEGGPLTWIYPAVTTGYTISFPQGEYNPNDVSDQALFLHEVTHVWQYERMGWIYAARAVHEEVFQDDAYVVHYDGSKSFTEYDLEEQAEIVAEYFLHRYPAYQKYIEFLQTSPN